MEVLAIAAVLVVIFFYLVFLCYILSIQWGFLIAGVNGVVQVHWFWMTLFRGDFKTARHMIDDAVNHVKKKLS